MNQLFIIGNEKISFYNKKFYSANVDFKTIVEGLNKYFKVILIARFSSKREIFKINYNKILLTNNIISYILNAILSLKNLRTNKYLIISITPYTFSAFVFLQFFSNEIYLYLRSDGHKEYEKILGKKWVFLYSFMYYFFLKNAKIISCEKKLVVNKNFFLVNPSEIDSRWFKKRKKITFNNIVKIIYVGRIRIEKGILSFVDLFSKIDERFQLTIVGDRYSKRFNIKNIKYLNFFSSIKALISQYDKSHILILPSYTESHPKVIYEALARLRPVIIFEDIKHVVKKTKGIFVCKRNVKNFIDKVNFIMTNYNKIQKKISLNTLPKKNIFISQLYNILR